MLNELIIAALSLKCLAFGNDGSPGARGGGLPAAPHQLRTGGATDAGPEQMGMA
jgi:hypothetical protein